MRRPERLAGRSLQGRLSLALLAMAIAPAAFALQTVEASDGVAVEAIVSLREPTRIRIDGAAITDVFGNIHSSQCGSAAPSSAAPGPAVPAPPVNPAGEIAIECDRERGEVYVRPVPQPSGEAARKPINLFIASAQATYTLLLRPADTPADTIVLRDPRAALARTQLDASSASGQAPQHVRALKAMLVAMAAERASTDLRVEEIHQPLQLWAEARLVLLRRFEGRGLVGERYSLQNVGAAPMVLVEQEFDRPDSSAGGQVAAVAIEHHNLKPGESTTVYVIRRGGER